jgi:hypothetical protein
MTARAADRRHLIKLRHVTAYRWIGARYTSGGYRGRLGRRRMGVGGPMTNGSVRQHAVSAAMRATSSTVRTMMGAVDRYGSGDRNGSPAPTRSSITCQTSLSNWFSFQMPYAVPSSTGGTATSPIAPLTAASTHSWPPRPMLS